MSNKDLKLLCSETHPLKSLVLNEQYLTKKEFIQKFKIFPWEDLLELQLSTELAYVQNSPSINLENKDGLILSASIVGDSNGFEFYVCYKRPIMRKKRKWFGLIEFNFYDKNFCSIIPEQTKEDSLQAFLYFFDENYEELEKRW